VQRSLQAFISIYPGFLYVFMYTKYRREYIETHLAEMCGKVALWAQAKG